MNPTNKVSAFENFNFYDILEPQKVHDVKTDVLVAIDDGKPDPELIGSFSDTVKKSQYDLVDLFQNIYVSPQHIKPKTDIEFEFPDLETNKLDVVSNNVEKEYTERTQVNEFVSQKHVEPTKTVNLDFTDFESIASNSNNMINYLKTEVTENENKQMERTISRRLDEILDNAILKQFTPSKLDRLRDPGLIVDEVDNILHTPINTVKNFDNEASFIKNITHLEKIYNDKEVKHSPPHFKEVEEDIAKVKSLLYKAECIDTTKFTPSSNLEKKKVLINVYQNDIKSSMIDLNKPVIASKFQTPIPMLQAKTKDKKVFAKRRIVTPDKDKIKFTKGPDLYEKSLILPQLMERLAIRKKNMEAKKNVTRKLILDRPNKVTMPDLSPIVLHSDCNKERLKDLRTRKAFREFVYSGH